MTFSPNTSILNTNGNNNSTGTETELGDFFARDDEDNGLRENPFGDDIGLRSNPFVDARQFYFILHEDALPYYERGERFTSQFTPQNFQRTKEATTTESGGYSMPSKLLQWINGGLETVTMQVRLFSMHRDDQTAAEKYEILKALSSALPDRNRPPLLLFFWGQVIPDGMKCLITSLGNETQDDIRPDGSSRGITLQMTLKAHTDFLLEQEDSQPVERTPTYTAKHGDTYELIANRFYGDPMYGVLLRRMNSRQPFEDTAPRLIADLEPGDKVKIFPKRDMQAAGKIKPECAILGSSGNAQHVRALIFEARNKKIGYLPRR